jgi:hypothetical protein
MFDPSLEAEELVVECFSTDPIKTDFIKWLLEADMIDFDQDMNANLFNTLTWCSIPSYLQGDIERWLNDSIMFKDDYENLHGDIWGIIASKDFEGIVIDALELADIYYEGSYDAYIILDDTTSPE